MAMKTMNMNDLDTYLTHCYALLLKADKDLEEEEKASACMLLVEHDENHGYPVTVASGSKPTI